MQVSLYECGLELKCCGLSLRPVACIQTDVKSLAWCTTFSPARDGFGRGSSSARFAVQLKPKDQRGRSVFEIINQVRGMARSVPGSTFNAGVDSPLGGGGGAGSVNMQIKGPDLDQLNDIAARRAVDRTDRADATGVLFH